MIVQLIFLVLVPALLIAAAGWDLATYRIPNVFPLALLVLFAVFAPIAIFTTTVSLADIGWHGAAFGVGLVAGIAFFAFGWIGGGDAKLFAAACLWLGWDALLHYAVYASLAGGALTIGLLTLRGMPLPVSLATRGWVMRLTDKKSGIPYGVALASGALAALSASDFYRAALGS